MLLVRNNFQCLPPLLQNILKSKNGHVGNFCFFFPVHHYVKCSEHSLNVLELVSGEKNLYPPMHDL